MCAAVSEIAPLLALCSICLLLSACRSAAEKRPNQHDFKAEFAQMAAAKGNYEFLKLLFADYEVPWTAAQVCQCNLLQDVGGQGHSMLISMLAVGQGMWLS